MRIPAELVDAVLAKSGPNNLGTALEHLQRVHEQIQGVKRRAEHALRSYESVLDGLSKEREAVQKTCPHPLMKRHRDPAGGSDSYSECVVCGFVDG